MSRIYVPVQVDRFLGYRSDLAATVAEPGWATELLNAVINHVGWLETRAGRKCYVFNGDILIVSTPTNESFIPQQLGVAPIYGARSVGLRTVRFYAAQEGLSSRIFCLSLRPRQFRRVGRGAQVIVRPDDPAHGIGEVLLQVDYNLPRLPVTNWQVWAVVPSGDWTLEVDPLRVGQWAQARTSDDPIMGFRRGLYCINLAPLGETGLILDRDVFQAHEILQFWGYKQVDGSIRPLFAPTLGEAGIPSDLGGLGYYRFPLGVGQWIIVPDIYNGDYRIGWVTQWIYGENGEYPRKVLTALANHTGELEAPMPLLLPPSEHEEVEWGLGLYRFKLPKAHQQISNPPYRPYLGSPDRTAALLSTEPDGVALLKFWEAVALKETNRDGLPTATTTVPGVFVDFAREYTITNGDGSEYTNIAAPVEIDDAADVYVWDDVKVKYRLVWKGNPELLESEKEHEEIAGTTGRVVVRTSKKLAPGSVREYYFEYDDRHARVEAVGSAVPTDADLRNPHQRNAAFPPDYIVKPSDLQIGGGEIKQRNTGVRRRELPKADGESRDLPMAMWRYRFMWEYEDGSFSAVSHPVVAYDTLWSVADDATLLALRLRHRASEQKVIAREEQNGPVTQFERSPRLSLDEAARREFPDAHLAARPYNAVRGVVDLLRPSLLLPELRRDEQVVVYRDQLKFAPVPLRSIYSVPRLNTWDNSTRFTWDKLLEEALAEYWWTYLQIRARLYPQYHRLVRGIPREKRWNSVRDALYDNPDLLVVVTSVVEGKGIVYEYVIAEGATHAGDGPKPERGVGPRGEWYLKNERDLLVNFKVRNVAKLVVPVFPRPGFPGWQMTLCTPEGWLRLGYQWRGQWMPRWSNPDDLDAQFATGTEYVSEIRDNLYRSLVELDASRAYKSWAVGDGLIEEWKQRGWGVPSALLVLPGETRSMRVSLPGDGDYRLSTTEQDADFVEEHMADGVWLNIVGIDNIFGSARAAAWGFAGFPTAYKIVESQLDSLEATASIPAEVRERLLVTGYVELPLVQRGQWVGIAPEWLSGGKNLGLSSAADWREANISSGDDGCAKLANRSLLTPLWAKPEYMKLNPAAPSVFQFYVRGSNLLDNLRNFRMFTDATSGENVQSPAPFVVDLTSGIWQVYVPGAGGNTTPDNSTPITWLFKAYEPATINNLEVKLYLPATRLLLHEQLTAAFPASLLFGAPRYRVVIPKENIPAGAVRLWVFRTRALLDNDWEDEEYGVAARLVIGDKERHEGIDWLDTVKDADLDFGADWRNYMFRRSNLRSCFAAEVNGVVYYGHLITDDYTGNMGEPNRYFGNDTLQSQLYQTPVWTFTSDTGDIPLALPMPTESTPMPLGLTEGDRRRIERAAPAYVRQSWVDEVGPHHEDVVWQVYPARSIYRSAVRLSADKYGILPGIPLDDTFRTSANIAWSSLPATLTLWLYESRRRQATSESGRVWRVYEVLYRNAETPEWGWVAARWIVSPGQVLGTRGATTVAITGIPVHQRHTTGFQTLVREYVLKFDGTLQAMKDTLESGHELEIGELREWTLTDPRGVWHSEMPDYVVQRTSGMRFRAERLKENTYQLRLYQRTEGESWEVREPVEAHLVNYEPDAVAWSVPGVPHNIPEGNILRVGQNTGGGISGLAVRESELVVFKRSAIYRLALLPDNPDMPIGRVDEISNSLGCIAPATIARVGQDVFFLSTNGVAVLSGATVRLLDEPVNAEIVWRLNRASLTGAGRRELATATFFAARNAYVLCLPVSRYDDPMFIEHRTVDAEEQTANLMEWHSLAGELFVFDLQRNYVTKFQFNLPGEDDYRDDVGRRAYISEARQDLERMMLLDSPLGLQLIGLDLIAPTRPAAAFPPRAVNEEGEPEGGAPLLCNMSILWRSDLYVDNYVHRIRTRFDELDELNVQITQTTEPSFMPIRFFWRSPWLLLGSLSDKRLRRVDIWVEPLAIRETCGHPMTDASGNPIPWYRSGRLRVRSLHVSRRADRPKGGNLADYSGNWRADGWIPMPPRTALLWAQPFDTQQVPLYPVPDPSGSNIVELHDYIWRDRTIPLGILVLRYGNQASRIFPRGSVWELVVDMPRLEYVTPDILNPSVYRSRGGLDAGREVGIAFAAEVENWGYTVLRGYAMYVRQVRSYLP
jgi:hypothetical protein